VDARADDRSRGPQGDRLRPGPGAVAGAGRGAADRRARRRDRRVGGEAPVRRGGHRPLHRRDAAVLLHPLAAGAAGPGLGVRDRPGQRAAAGGPRGVDVGPRRPEEGGVTAMIPLRYNLRNLRVRWVTTLLTVLATGLVVGSSCVLFGMVDGLQHSLKIS